MTAKRVSDVPVLEEPGRWGIPLDASLRSYDAKAVSDMTASQAVEPSQTQQQFKEEVDINTIVERFGITQFAPLREGAGVYGDFSGITDYDSAAERIREADRRFMQLPAEIRDKFRNDPGVLIRAASQLDEESFTKLFVSSPVVLPAGGVEPAAPATS